MQLRAVCIKTAGRQDNGHRARTRGARCHQASVVPMMSGTGVVRGRSIRWAPVALGQVVAVTLISVLAACHKEEKAAATPIRPVRTMTVELDRKSVV